MADAPKAASAPKKDPFPIIILLILLAGAGGWAKFPEVASGPQSVTLPANYGDSTSAPENTLVAPSAKFYSNTQNGFTFSYPESLYVHERANGVILLPTPTFPNIQSEIYALGRYIVVSKNPIVGPYERAVTKTQFVQNITTEENMFEGKPTKVGWVKVNGLDMLRIEHVNPNSPHTLNYYIFSGNDYYNIQMHPYEGAKSNSKQLNEFMFVVNSFRMIQ